MGTLVRNTTFSGFFAGQITGVFGLIGSGRTETAKVVSGAMKRDFFHGGQVRLEWDPPSDTGCRGRLRDGIIYVTEDRKLEGFFEDDVGSREHLSGRRRGRGKTNRES